VPADDDPATVLTPEIGTAIPWQSAIPFEPRFLYEGDTRSQTWEVAVDSVTVEQGAFTVNVAAVPPYHSVYDYLRFVDENGREHRFEAEDLTVTRGDVFSSQPGADGHWWLQSYDPFSEGRGLVAEGLESVPELVSTVLLPDGQYQLFLGTFTGDPANGPFAIALDY
jgi:hypothetical protein